jgi:hypothetical protein
MRETHAFGAILVSKPSEKSHRNQKTLADFASLIAVSARKETNFKTTYDKVI